MTIKEIIYLVVILILILFSAFFSAGDIIVSTSNNAFLKKKSKKSKRYKTAYALSLDYPNTISTLLFSNNLVNIAISSLSTTLALSLFKDKNTATVSTLTVIIVTITLLTFGEILPKTLTKPYSNTLIKYVSPIIKFFKILFFPFIWITNKICNFLTFPFKKYIKDNPEGKMGDEELIEMAESINEEGVIDKSQTELLKNAIQFSDTKVFEIMTPRVDVVGLDINDYDFNKENCVQLLHNSRIVIYEDNLDKIIGIINSKVLLKKLVKNEKIEIRKLMANPIFIPRTLGIYETFKMFNEKKEHIAIVIDEFGGCEGIVTMEDILEELVGDIWDETDKIQEDVKKIGPKLYFVSGSLNIDDFFETFSLIKDEDFDEDAYTTLSGFITDKLGKFGEVNDIIQFQHLSIKILKMDDKVIDNLEIKVGKRKTDF